ncbi:hypothetical protein [Streptomyces sp. NPDC002467]|uniref:hypothetical protein n=1 Tax=Streptomyces sp. NPDC002467 TaxID=3364647 RepID=UPI00367CA6BD
MSRIVLDVVERTVAAYVTTFLGLLLAVDFNLTDVTALKAAAIASIPAALSVVKGAVGAVLGDPSTAGWLPRPRG